MKKPDIFVRTQYLYKFVKMNLKKNIENLTDCIVFSNICSENLGIGSYHFHERNLPGNF